MTEIEAASQNLLVVKREVACIICQGVYDGTAPGTVEWTFHLDCGNGYALSGEPPPACAQS